MIVFTGLTFEAECLSSGEHLVGDRVECIDSESAASIPVAQAQVEHRCVIVKILDTHITDTTEFIVVEPERGVVCIEKIP